MKSGKKWTKADLLCALDYAHNKVRLLASMQDCTDEWLRCTMCADICLGQIENAVKQMKFVTKEATK